MTGQPPPSRKAVLLRAAAGALLASQAPWIWIIADQFRMGAAPLAAWNALVAVLALLTAAFLWMGDARAAGAAPVQCYYIAGFSAFWALRTHHWLPWLGVAAPAAAVALLTAWRSVRKEPEAPKAPAEAADESVGPWLKENVEAIVIAFIMALVIRCFCIEVFKIPSSSMEPTLMGDARDGSRGGDRIMVTKYYYTVSDVERFDVVVFKFPLNQPKNFIKRVVGLPGEEIKIIDGDIYARPKGEAAFRIARKTLRVQDSLWIDPFGGPKAPATLADSSIFEERWKAAPLDGDGHAAYDVQGGELATRERDGRRDLRFSLKDPSLLGDGGGAKDMRLAFDFEITSPRGFVFAEVRNSHGRFEARFCTDEPSVLAWHGPDTKQEHLLRDLKIVMDRRYRVDLSVFDGEACVRVNGDLMSKVAFIDTEANAAKRDNEAAPGLSFGSSGLTFRARDISVGRDICYRGKSHIDEGQAVAIKEDHYVMMGDNVGSSHDSRAWTQYAYRLRGRAEPVECESQETTDSGTEHAFIRRIAEKYGLTKYPDVGIKADKYGNEWALYRGDPPERVPPGAPVGIIVESEPPGPSPFVHRDFIVGKAFWVWWPRSRWFRLIR